MNAEQLQAIKERAEKATAGPWYSHADGTVFLKHTQEIADIWTDNEEADAQFIANARQDVPELIAEIERLQQEVIKRGNYFNEVVIVEYEKEKLRVVLDTVASFISIGESAKANDIICRALGVDINHYGIYGEEEE